MAHSPRQYNPKTDQEHIETLLCDVQDVPNISEWENRFINDLIEGKREDELWSLTSSQYAKLIEISEKEDDYEVW